MLQGVLVGLISGGWGGGGGRDQTSYLQKLRLVICHLRSFTGYYSTWTACFFLSH